MLAAQPDFKLVGRDEDLKRLSSVLLRNKAASVVLVGPGGVGATTLCLGLQAAKANEDAIRRMACTCSVRLIATTNLAKSCKSLLIFSGKSIT